MGKTISLLLVSAILLVLSGCGQAVSGQVIQSDKPRNTSPTVDETDLTKLVDGNSAFAFDLYQVLRQTDGNLFYSPYSLSLIHI